MLPEGSWPPAHTGSVYLWASLGVPLLAPRSEEGFLGLLRETKGVMSSLFWVWYGLSLLWAQEELLGKAGL